MLFACGALSGVQSITPFRLPRFQGTLALPVLVWFRDDFRLADNPALSAAVRTGAPVLCFSIVENDVRPLGGASRWWLHGSLESFGNSLSQLGSRLVLFRGSAEELVPKLVMDTGATAMFWNRRYGETEIATNSRLRSPARPSGECPWRASVPGFSTSRGRSGISPESRSAFSRPTAGPPWRAPLRPLSRLQGKSSAANGLNRRSQAR